MGGAADKDRATGSQGRRGQRAEGKGSDLIPVGNAQRTLTYLPCVRREPFRPSTGTQLRAAIVTGTRDTAGLKSLASPLGLTLPHPLRVRVLSLTGWCNLV